MGLNQRLRLFRVGADAVQRVLGRAGEYICPICGDSFAEAAVRSGDLSLEHVPPRAVGGRGIVLTCRSCNNTAGHMIDAELHRRELNHDFVKFMLGRQSEFGRHVTLGLDVEEVRVRLARDQECGVTTFHILEESNDPDVVEKVGEYIDDMITRSEVTREQLTVRSGIAYHPQLAKVAELKSAFLVGFAALGYRYALSPALALVRQQIRLPGDEIIPEPWTIHVTVDHEHMLLLAEDPFPLLVVKLGESGVILPWVTSGPGFFGQVRARHGDRRNFQLAGTPIPWPRRLELLLDME